MREKLIDWFKNFSEFSRSDDLILFNCKRMWSKMVRPRKWAEGFGRSGLLFAICSSMEYWSTSFLNSSQSWMADIKSSPYLMFYAVVLDAADDFSSIFSTLSFANGSALCNYCMSISA